MMTSYTAGLSTKWPAFLAKAENNFVDLPVVCRSVY